MTDKEFRHLRRAELIDIIYELQNNEAELQEEISVLKKQLEDKQLKISKAGSIAEAAVSLNGFFECAQATANQYLQEIYRARKKAEQKLQQAEAKAKAIVAEALEQAEKILEDAQSESNRTPADITYDDEEQPEVHGDGQQKEQA